MKRSLWVATLLSAMLSVTAFGQSGNGRISGTIDDPTGAVLPGVTVTATNTATGVVAIDGQQRSRRIQFRRACCPEPYKVTAELPGFQTKVLEAQVGNAQEFRLNIRMTFRNVATTDVDVSVAVDTLLATSSSSVGTVLSEQRMQSLPLVGNNIMGLLDTLPGTRMDANGVTGTFNGLGRSVNVTRDGMESSGAARNMQAGMTPSTFMSPDLVGEIRMIVAPVDAEMGRGNGQMQVFTRSGTNQFSGSAVWSVRNTALDANTWANNRAVDPRTGEWKPSQGLDQPKSIHGQPRRADRQKQNVFLRAVGRHDRQ